ncbi:MAG: response regulator [Treponema sp.]|jgi:signal transduction histidine kinase/CheY-like chemotaxis protein|nr:response regulator [Treponema sp.]
MKKNRAGRVFLSIPEEYRGRFEEERLETNIVRMLGFSVYIVILQIVLQVANVLYPQGGGEGMQIPLIYYIVLSLATLFTGAVYWILLDMARRHKIRGRRSRVFLVQSLLYIYTVIQMGFCTFNILSHQGINGQIILVLLFGMVPVLRPAQSAASILASFVYTLAVLFFTQGIVDKSGKSAWEKLLETDMRAYFIIINGITILISAFIYRLYVSNFLKGVELENSNANLEKTVRERTKELEEKTVAAEAASRAKSRFLSSMSHEIRTPLNAIIGMAQIAGKAETMEKARASAEKISAASNHLFGVLGEILDMSNIESGKMKIENARFVFDRVMNEVVSIIGERCQAKGITFTNNAADFPRAAVMGDKLRLKQILINLLDNAVKFTPEDGSVDFTVRVTEETASSFDVSFIVTDNGIGITEEQQGKLFAAFEQGSVNSMKHGGMGLGLAISRGLAEMMGGTITVKSAPAKGSVFTLALPLEKAASAPDEDKPAVPDLSGRHILSVEDIEINRMVLTELLAETGAVIDEAADGLEALEKFAASPEGYYCFIFMDLLMPHMNGYDAAMKIRAMDRADAASVPIVALSANAYQEDVKKALDAGMNGHLTKPIDFALLMKTLAEKIRVV